MSAALLQYPGDCGRIRIDVLASHADSLQDGMRAESSADCAAKRLSRIPDLISRVVLAHTIRIALGQEDLLQHPEKQKLFLDHQLIATQGHSHNVALI